MFRFSSLNRRSRAHFTGLDIGPTDIKMMQLSGMALPQRRLPLTLQRLLQRPLQLLRQPQLQHQPQPQLQHYASTSLPSGLLSEDGIDDLALLIDTLRSLLDGSTLPTNRVVIGIPANMTVTTLQAIDVAPPLNLKHDQLQALASALVADKLPYPASEAGIDFCVLPPAQAGQQASMFIAATRQEIIEDLLAMHEALGLQAIAVDISIYAAYAAWLQMDSIPAITVGQVAGLMHIDARHMQCTLFDGPQSIPYQTHDAPAAAANAKSMARAAVALVRQAMTQSGATRLTHLILSGASADMTGLSAALRQHLRIDKVVTTTLADIRLATGIDAEQWQAQAPAYLAAYGLALRNADT